MCYLWTVLHSAPKFSEMNHGANLNILIVGILRPISDLPFLEQTYTVPGEQISKGLDFITDCPFSVSIPAISLQSECKSRVFVPFVSISYLGTTGHSNLGTHFQEGSRAFENDFKHMALLSP